MRHFNDSIGLSFESNQKPNFNDNFIDYAIQFSSSFGIRIEAHNSIIILIKSKLTLPNVQSECSFLGKASAHVVKSFEMFLRRLRLKTQKN